MPCVCSSLHTSSCDARGQSARDVKVAFFLFPKVEPATEEVSALRAQANGGASESRQPFCNFGPDLRVIDCIPRCFAAVMATIMQRFLFLASNREMETARSSKNLGRRFPGCSVVQAEWCQDLIHELIMCVVRGWACGMHCGHDDWQVEVGLFPVCSCV